MSVKDYGGGGAKGLSAKNVIFFDPLPLDPSISLENEINTEGMREVKIQKVEDIRIISDNTQLHGIAKLSISNDLRKVIYFD